MFASCGFLVIDGALPVPVPSDLDTLRMVVWSMPTDRAAVAALTDAVQESGRSRLAAVREVNRFVRDAVAWGESVRVRALISGEGAASARCRTAVRDAVGRRSNTSIPITVVPGDAAPILSGEDAYHTFRSGGLCRSPGAARRAGYRTEYHASTLSITVGAGWLAVRFPARPARARKAKTVAAAV